MTSGQTLDLSGITNSLSGNLTIEDSTGNENITGTSVNDTLTLSSGMIRLILEMVVIQ